MTEYLPFLNEFFYKELSMEIIGYLGVKTRPYSVHFTLYSNNRWFLVNYFGFTTSVTYSSIEAKRKDKKYGYDELKGNIIKHLSQDTIDKFNICRSSNREICKDDIRIDCFGGEDTFDPIHVY